MKSLINGVGGGFGRVLGRLIAYLLIAFIFYFVLKGFDIDLSEILQKLRRFLYVI